MEMAWQDYMSNTLICFRNLWFNSTVMQLEYFNICFRNNIAIILLSNFWIFFQLAEIKVKLIEARDALEMCIALQDFNQASLLKEKITELEGIKSDLLKEAEEPQTKEIFTEKVLYLYLPCIFI